jgi:hypothetical protein
VLATTIFQIVISPVSPVCSNKLSTRWSGEKIQFIQFFLNLLGNAIKLIIKKEASLIEIEYEDLRNK